VWSGRPDSHHTVLTLDESAILKKALCKRVVVQAANAGVPGDANGRLDIAPRARAVVNHTTQSGRSSAPSPSTALRPLTTLHLSIPTPPTHSQDVPSCGACWGARTLYAGAAVVWRQVGRPGVVWLTAAASYRMCCRSMTRWPPAPFGRNVFPSPNAWRVAGEVRGRSSNSCRRSGAVAHP